MTAPIGYSRRRSRGGWRCAAYNIVFAIAGAAAALAFSAWRPWGFAPPPGSLEPLEPRPGRLLLSADDADAAQVIADSVRQFGPPAGATATVRFIRGRRGGLLFVRALCTPPRRLLLPNEAAQEWRVGGRTIIDLTGAAMCYAHPLLRDPPSGAAT